MKKLDKIDKALLQAIGIYLAVIAALILISLLFSCTASHKMVMPDGCKKKKPPTYEMVKPEPTIKRKK